MRALQFSEFGPVSKLRLVELPDPKTDAVTAVDRRDCHLKGVIARMVQNRTLLRLTEVIEEPLLLAKRLFSGISEVTGFYYLRTAQ